MNNSIQVFDYEDFTVRTYTDENGDIWFVAKDVCEVLGIRNHKDAVSGLDDDEKRGVAITDPIGREQITTVINEPGLYKLTFRSKKPQAKEFTRWVTHDVLPTLRKTGSYSLPSKKQETPKIKQDDKPALPQTSAPIKGADKILSRVLKCKTKEDCEAVLALDKAFQEAFGRSALDTMGLYLVTHFRGIHAGGSYCIDWDSPRYEWRYRWKKYEGDEPDERGYIFDDVYYSPRGK